MKPTLNPSYQIYTANERPELWKILKDDTHPLNAAWPVYLDQDACFQKYHRQLSKYDGLAEYQYAMVEEDCGKEEIIACGRSLPFFWPELDQVGGRARLQAHPEVWDTLPDTGYDTILTRGVNQYLCRQGLLSVKPPTLDSTIDPTTKYLDDDCFRIESPNALSAISITVHPEYRSIGIAESMIQAMKQTAHRKNLEILVVPLRPTRKSEYPFVTMEEYIKWSHQPSMGDANPAGGDLPFDPWLRKHVRLGAKTIKVARNSMHVEGTLAEWQKWTKCDQWKTHAEAVKLEKHTGQLYIEVSFPGGLVPLRLYVQENRCVYDEPNVWLYHDVN